MTGRFQNRAEAGKRLAIELMTYKGRKDALVLALPRGGVAVAAEVAREFDLPLDLMLVRKLGVPGDEELAMGAIAMGGVCLWNEDIVSQIRISPRQKDAVVERERVELQRRNLVYRKGLPPPDLHGLTVILVDDGMATGADMLAAVQAARQLGARIIVVAVPVASEQAVAMLAREADEVISLSVPAYFSGVGSFYDDFDQLTDEDVARLMNSPR